MSLLEEKMKNRKEDKLKIGVIGLGGRGLGLLEQVMFRMKDISIVAVSDLYQDRVDNVINKAKKKRLFVPKGFTDYKEMLSQVKVDAVIVSASWNHHTEIAMHCMRMGIPVGVEVGGAYNLQECYDLIKCYEETKTPYMMLENCCYGEDELAVLNMVQKGLFGDVVHMKGGYRHDLRYEIVFGKTNRHYRLNEYMNRNCENYPTHEIGPISKVLNITYGNKFDSLVSYASSSKGLSHYVDTRKKKNPDIDYLSNSKWQQGDIVTTMIKCHNGETIVIDLDTSLPRHYSRGFEAHGTKAMFSEDLKKLYLDTNNKFHVRTKSRWYMRKKFRHPIWKWFKSFGVKGGHGGMDWLVFKAFFDAVRKGDGNMPIDIYEAVTWMAITTLSEQSIQKGCAVDFPDFTNGNWNRKQKGRGFFFLEK